MDFFNLYAHGFARVAACTIPVAIADPRVERRGRARARPARWPTPTPCLAVFPELTPDRLLDRRPGDAGRRARRATADALDWLVPQTDDLLTACSWSARRWCA